ncbi:MAG: M15 family peptidase [Candidatus Thorarchaeota archaeon]|jgi:hypothetical protein
MSLNKQQQIFAVNAARLILKIDETEGYACTFGEAHRPPEMAKIYKAKGIGIMDSLHALRLALDLNLFYKGEYCTKTEDHEQFGEYWESLHPDNVWGGRFDDGNHYEQRR